MTDSTRPLVLAETKLAVPSPSASALRRTRLLNELRSAMPLRLAALIAPAGYGKTTLVEAWVRYLSRTASVGWFSLDERDADPIRFWTYMAECVERLGAEVDERLLAELRSDADALEDLVAALVNGLSRIEGEVVITLDDLHRISNVAVVQELFRLIETAPDNVMFVVTSRVAPDWPLEHLRIRQRAFVLTAEDLALDLAETTAVLSRAVTAVRLDPSAMETIHRRTQGWPVVVQLAADGVNRHHEPERLVAGLDGTNRVVAQYLLEEVLSGLKPEHRRLLLDLAVCERYSVELASAVIGEPASPVIDELRAELLFVSADRRDEWVGPHPLVRDLLLAELEAEDPERLPLLHRRASNWHRQQGDMSRAIEHLIAAQAFSEAMELVAEVIDDYWLAGRVSTVLRWLDLLPVEQVELMPGAAAQLARMLAAHARFDEASDWIDVADRAVRSDLDRVEVLFSRLVLERGLGHPEEVLSVADSIDELATRSSDPEARDVIRRRQVDSELFRAAVEEVTGKHDQRRAAVDRFEAARAEATPIVDFAADQLIAYWRAEDGELAEAERQARYSLKHAGRRGFLEFHTMAHAHVALARVAWCRGDLAEAQAELLQAAQLDHGEAIMMRITHAVCAAEIFASADRYDRADEVLDSAWLDDLVDWPSRRLRPLVAGWGLWMSAVHGRRPQADRWLAELERFGSLDKLSAPLWARSALVRGHPEPIVARFAIDGAHLPREPLLRLRCGTVLHAALRQLGHKSQAATLASGLVAGAERSELVQPLIDEPALVDRLDLDAVEVPSQYFLDQLRTASHTESARDSATMPSDLVEGLSARELDVIAYLPSRMTNKQIASELYVSLNTIKSHLRSVYRKLGVTARDDAIVRCEELGLL